MGQYSGVGVLDKAMHVLLCVAQGPCTLSELCERTELPRATAHRLAAGLEQHGMLTRSSTGRWHIGPRPAELAHSARDPLAEAAAPALADLRDATGESVQLYRRDGTERVCVANAEPTSGLRDTVPAGTRLSMRAGSGAQVLAAWAPEEVRRRLLADATFTEATLKSVRSLGWASSAAERAPGVASVAVPVHAPDGAVIAAVSVSGPEARIARRAAAAWARDLDRAAESMGADL